MKAGRKYLRAAEIALLTGMSVRTVRRWIKGKVLPSIKLGGARLVATADLEAVLSASPEAPLISPDNQEEYDYESDL